MPSPVRRSMRGAPPATKPPPPASTASSSSLSSTRQDRSTRATNPHQKSTTPHSLSSEDTSDPPRRSQRAHPTKDDDAAAKPTADAGEDAGEEEEEEVTRCICGQQDYPGPPLSEAFSAAEAQAEDAGGLFISCDGCSVWQHGGCVGIVEERQVPDKYFCEECRPKLHELHTDARGYVRGFSLLWFFFIKKFAHINALAVREGVALSLRDAPSAFGSRGCAYGKSRLQQASISRHMHLFISLLRRQLVPRGICRNFFFDSNTAGDGSVYFVFT